jgi:Methyltransferase domain
VPDLATIPGWLDGIDEALLRFFLRTQVETGERGDLAELGVFMGRSAVVLGDYVQPGEAFTVVDLFEQAAPDDANRDENRVQYPELTQREFERQYLRFHPTLPTVVRGYSQTITKYAPHGTHRLVHIDASHLYEHVVADIAAAKTLLSPTGIVVFDDIRESHTPGSPRPSGARSRPAACTRWPSRTTSCTRRGASPGSGRSVWRTGPTPARASCSPSPAFRFCASSTHRLRRPWGGACSPDSCRRC